MNVSLMGDAYHAAPARGSTPDRVVRPTEVGRDMSEQHDSMYDRVGGTPWFEALTSRFYAGVAADPVLRPLYPAGPAGLEQSREHLCGFLVQYWGGPASYSAERGHPRLRMRHAPFPIGPAERDAWYRHMADAVAGAGIGPEDEQAMLAYFETAATHMINTR
jgi:hemoglobin